MNNLKKIFYILKSQKRAVVFLGVFFLFSSLLELLGIGAIYPYLSLLQDPAMLNQYPWLKNILNQMGLVEIKTIYLVLGLAIMALLLLKSLSYFAAQYLINFLNLEIIRKLKLRLYRAYLSAPWSFHLEKNSTLLISTILNDVYNFGNNMVQGILSLINESIFLLAFVFLITLMEPKLLVIAGFLGVLLLVFQQISKKRTLAYGKQGSEANGEGLKMTSQGLISVLLAKIHHTQEYFLQRTDHFNKVSVKAASRYYAFLLLPRISFETIFFLSFFTYIIVQILSGSDVVSLFSLAGSLMIAATRLIPSLTRLSNSFSGLKNGQASMDKVYADLVALESHENAKQVSTGPLPFEKELQIRDLSFTYGKAPSRALDGINITIKRGSTIGLIGRSGSGKTTLANILLGLFEPETGEVLIDGVSIKGRLIDWQKHLGYVPQQIILLDDSLRANIAFGLEEKDIDDARVFEALRLADLQELVEKLPLGINTLVGENGARLSGGQRQRIGIARALYRNPDVLIFDEATSALDSETESVISEAIMRIGKEKTLLIVAHRLTTLKNCDQIYRMANGRIVASGTYQEVVLNAEPEEKSPGLKNGASE